MTGWPLICDRCGTKQYVGVLYGGLCSDCHSDVTRENLADMDTENTGQSALADFA